MLVHLESEQAVGHVKASLQALGLATEVMRGEEHISLLIKSPSREVPVEDIRGCAGVVDVATVASKHPLIDQHGPVVEVGGVFIGGHLPVLMAGPCSVESEVQIHDVAGVVAAAGGTFLRGGAFKPRTSPYGFQGRGEEALAWMVDAAAANDLKVVTEAMGVEHLDAVADAADLIQIGSRNMQNYTLLRAVGAVQAPVLLKRSASATIKEWLLAAEHLLHAGASGVILCERGIRSFDTETRNLLDLGAVALLRDVYNLPVIVDPSHALGRRDLIQRMGLAGLAAGASGLLIEAHPSPGVALSDGPQQLSHGELLALGSSMGLMRHRQRCTREQ